MATTRADVINAQAVGPPRESKGWFKNARRSRHARGVRAACQTRPMARRERGKGTGATPAVLRLTGAGIPFAEHHYEHDEAALSYGLEAADALGVEPSRVFKTLVVSVGSGLGVTVLPVDRQLDLKAAGAGFGVKKVTLAEQAAAERATGYVVGGISPFGQRSSHPTLLDESALEHETIFVSGGRRGFDIEVPPSALITLLQAHTAPITR